MGLKISRLRGRAILGILLVGAILTLSTQTMAMEDLEASLPADTIFFGSLDIEACRNKAGDLAVSRFFQTEDIRKFSDHIWSLIKSRHLTPKEFSLFNTFMETVGILFKKGNVISMAVTGVGSSPRGGFPIFVLSLQSDETPALKEHLTGLFEGFGLNPTARKELTALQTEMMHISLEDASPFPDGLFLAFQEDRVLLGNNEKGLTGLLERMKTGNAPNTLKELDKFKRLKKRLVGDGTGFFYALNLRALAAAVNPKDDPSEPFNSAVMGCWGFDQIHWIGMSSLLQGHLLVDTFQVVYADRQGLFSLLDGFPPGFDTSHPVPDGAVVYSAIKIDASRFLNCFKEGLACWEPSALESLEQGLKEVRKQYGMDMEACLGALGETMTVYLDLPKYGYLPEIVLMSDVRDPDRLDELQQGFRAFLKSEGFSLKEVLLQDELTGYYLSPQLEGLPFNLVYCVHEDKLMVACSVMGMKRALKFQRREDWVERSIYRASSFERSLAATRSHGGADGKDLVGILYVDLGRVLSTLYNNFAPWAGALTRDVSFPLDMSLLPGGDLIDEYFDAMVFVAESYRDGPDSVISIRSASPIGFTPFLLGGLSSSIFLFARAEAPAPPVVYRGENEEKIEMEQRPNILYPPQDAPFMGVYLDTEGTPDPGILITGIIPDTPAQKAGLAEGDLLIKVGKRGVSCLEDLQKAMAFKKPGDEVTLIVIREGEVINATLILARAGDYRR